MRHATPFFAVLALLAALAAGNAGAQHKQQPAPAAPAPQKADRTPQAQEEQAGNAAQQPQRKPGEQPVAGQPQGQPEDPAQSQATVSGKPPPPRRNVPANVARMPQPGAPQAYGPVLHEMGPQTTMPTPAPPGLPGPAPINNCTGGQCRDTSGNTYNTGVGNAAISSDGKLCNRTGNTVQCF
jgi:hypothetical protein